MKSEKFSTRRDVTAFFYIFFIRKPYVPCPLFESITHILCVCVCVRECVCVCVFVYMCVCVCVLRECVRAARDRPCVRVVRAKGFRRGRVSGADNGAATHLTDARKDVYAQIVLAAHTPEVRISAVAANSVQLLS